MKHILILAGCLAALSCLASCGRNNSVRTGYYSSFTAKGEEDTYEMSGKARIADTVPLAYIDSLEETTVKLTCGLILLWGDALLLYVTPDREETVIFDSRSAGHMTETLSIDIRINKGSGYLEFRGKDTTLKFDITLNGIDRDKISRLSVEKKTEKGKASEENSGNAGTGKTKAVFTDEDTEEEILDTALADDTTVTISAGIEVTSRNEEKMEFRGFDLFYQTDSGDEIKVLEYETDETALGGYTWQDHFNRQILLPAGTNELYFRNHDGSNYRIELNIKVKKD